MRDLLEREIKERKLSVRGLARLLAGEDGDHDAIEKWRRALNRYLKGSLPKEEAATRMEDVFGKPTGYFPRHQPERREGADGRFDPQALSLAALAATVDSLTGSLATLKTRVEKLERRRPRKAAGTARGAQSG